MDRTVAVGWWRWTEPSQLSQQCDFGPVRESLKPSRDSASANNRVLATAESAYGAHVCGGDGPNRRSWVRRWTEPPQLSQQCDFGPVCESLKPSRDSASANNALVIGCRSNDVDPTGDRHAPAPSTHVTPIFESRCVREYRAGRFVAAAQACEERMRKNPADAGRAYAVLAQIALGRHSRASKLARQGRARSGPHGAALYLGLEGLAVLATGDHAGALKRLDEAVRLTDPPLAPVLVSRAMVRFVAGSLEGALDDATLAQRIDPSNATAELTLGYLALTGGPSEWKYAARHFAQAAVMDPSHSRGAVCHYAITLASDGPATQPVGAWEQRLLELPRRGEAARDDILKWAIDTDGKYGAAQQLAEAHLLLGLLAETERDAPRARAEYEAALATSVHSMDVAVARARLGVVRADAGL